MDHLQSIKAFVTVVRLESFTKASTQLSMAPSVLSRAIANLETHTRTKLLNRSTRHVSLAEGARDYLTTCSDLLDRLRDSEQRLLADRDTQTGVIRVLAHPFAIETGLTQIIERYRRNTPNVNAVLHIADGPVRLEHGEHDVAVYPRHLIQDGGAVCRPLLRSQFVLAASKAYLDRVGHAPSPHDFSGQVLVSSAIDGHAQPDLTLDLDGAVITPVAPAVTMVVSEPVAVQLALSGFGMALVPRATVERHIAGARLQFVLPNSKVTHASADLDVAFVRRQMLPRRTREFVDTCVQFFEPVAQPAGAQGLAVAASPLTRQTTH